MRASTRRLAKAVARVVTRPATIAMAIAVAGGGGSSAIAYPLYGSEERGIGRLEAARLAHEGIIPGREKVTGELLSVDEVDLRLLDRKDIDLPAPDANALARLARRLLRAVISSRAHAGARERGNRSIDSSHSARISCPHFSAIR